MIDHDHEREPHQHAWNKSGEEQAADGHVGADAVDHHRQARRDDRADGCCCSADRGCGLGTIARLLHRANFDRAGPRRVGDGGPHHAREDHARQNAGVRVAAAQRTHERGREAHDAIGELGRAENVAHEDEQGRGDERKRVHRLRHLLRHDRGRESAEEHEGERRQSHRRVERHAEQDRGEPDADDLQHELDHSTTTSGPAGGRRGRRSVSVSSIAPCSAVTAPPSTSGAYSHDIESGSEVASRSKFFPMSPTL